VLICKFPYFEFLVKPAINIQNLSTWEDDMRLYVENEKCSGCRACLVACSMNLFGENNPKKAALTLIPRFPEPGVYEMKVCTQCGECAMVCPTDAIKKNANGVYFVEFSECILCEACVPVCPEGVMYLDSHLAQTAWKCDLCGDCVSVCGTSALSISA
jgi:Fe-S-cluster-containing hydrogenase component 2